MHYLTFYAGVPADEAVLLTTIVSSFTSVDCEACLQRRQVILKSVQDIITHEYIQASGIQASEIQTASIIREGGIWTYRIRLKRGVAA